jgi:hypothetical protein
MTVVMLGAAAAIALSGPASAAPGPSGGVTGGDCPQVCLAVYDPVVCVMSDLSLHTFSNRCVAEVYACTHRLELIGCLPAPA